ncbi:MAG: DNA mismatch repair endonuclease MutL [Candidatus Omnitrophota bacterium]
MKHVHILPPEIISKIAAGEVIDRPASVIKELLENSLDAGAGRIEIELTQAGKAEITIRDNGSGIPQEDMKTIFHRHATSKITKADDLFDIHSLGFRGEALYSICSVADIVLRSKTAGQDNAWEIHVRGGDRLALKPVPANNGTEITVKELFFNTPARRKFLKTNTSEMNRILNTVIPYCLLYPQKSFTLTHGEKSVLDLPPAESTKHRAAAVLNLDPNCMIKAQKTLPDKGVSIRAVLGDINISRSRRDMQYLFINGRPVQNKNISFHMNDVYRLILPPRHFPFFCLFIDMPAGDLDVNIHPTKREVKIRDEQTLAKHLRRLCEDALMQASRPKQAAYEPAQEPAGERPSVREWIDKALKDQGRAHEQIEKSFDDLPVPGTGQTPSGDRAPHQRPTEAHTIPEYSAPEEFSQHLFSQKQDSLREQLNAARFSGIFRSTYLFFESGKTLLIIDQHAAQERIMFEQLIAQMRRGKLEVQRLLSPYLVSATVQEMTVWQEAQERFSELGFESSAFDETTIAVHTHPALVQEPETAFRELLAEGDIARCDHETLARRACRASVMAGDRLNAEQADYQREQLLQCKDPFTCPHGRPTVIEMTEDFLRKQFLRT